MDQEASGSKLERPLGPGEAFAFSKQNYEGQQQRITADTALLDFPAASLRIGPKTGVTVFYGENYEGPSQELTTDLNSFAASRLQGQPKSLKIWSAAGKPFTGWWAIGIKVADESAEARYLSAGPDGLLTTHPRVFERERFRITLGLTGWASAKYLTLVPPPPSDATKPLPNPRTGDQYRATAKLNVRQGPGTNFKAVGYLQSKEVAEVLEVNADGSWLRIRRKPDARETLLGRRRVTFSVPDIPFTEPVSTLQPRPLFINDLENLTFVDEPEAGFRKFSLLSQDNRWIRYNPDANHFLTSARAEERTIFCQSIKIAEDETQVGELLQGEAALYENLAYWGRAWIFYTDYADFDRVLDLDEEVSSIQLGPQTGATIYREAQFKAKVEDKEAGKQDVTSNLASLAQEQVGENKISSMQLWRVVPPGGSDVKVQCCLSQDFRGKEADFKEYSAYRTTLRLPPTVQTVEVWTTDEAEIEVEDQKYSVSEDQPVVLKPNLAGCLVITTDAIGDFGGSLRSPGLKIRTDTMQPHERIVIFPDQEVHAKLAEKLENDPDALWNASYTDEKGIKHNVMERAKDAKTAEAQQKNAAEAQKIIQKVMSTVKYSEGNAGTRAETISPPDELHKKGWVLYFRTYMVTADTLYVREGAGREFKSIGFLRKNDIVEPLETASNGSWTKVRRLSDGLTGWSSSRYLKTGERYRVTARRLHLREGPGTQFPSLGYVEANDIVTSIGVNEAGTWRQIRRSDGRTGWSAARYFALLPSPPLSPVSGQPQTVKYQEISQGEVQALLAVAQSPEAALAQWSLSSVFRAIRDAIKDAVSITVSKIKDALTIIVEMVDKAVAWVVDTAEKVVAFVEGIFSKIGAFIKDVIQWLRFMFEWDDILKTRDYLSGSINQALDYLGSTFVDQVKEAVTNSAGSMQGVMMGFLNKAITALGGDADQADEPGPASSLIESIKSSGVPDAIEWILSKVMAAVRGALSAFDSLLEAVGVGDGNEPLDEEWDQDRAETFVTGLEKIAAAPAGVADVIVMLARNPDQPLPALASLLEVFRDLLCDLIDFGEQAILGLLDSFAYVVRKFREIIARPFRIPFISDLIDWINRLPGINIRPFPPLLDVFSLILAIPTTVISKIKLGEAPFSHVPVLAQGTSGLDIAAGIAGCLGALLDGALDAFPTKQGTKAPGWVVWLETLSMLCGGTCWALDHQARLQERDEETEHPNPIRTSEWTLFIVDGVLWLVDLWTIVVGPNLGRMNKKLERNVQMQSRRVKSTSLKPVPPVTSTSSPIQARRFKRAWLPGAWMASVAGVGHLALMIWKADDTDEGVGYAIADALTTAPEILSFLSTFPANPWAKGILVGSDVVAAGANIGGMF